MNKTSSEVLFFLWLHNGQIHTIIYSDIRLLQTGHARMEVLSTERLLIMDTSNSTSRPIDFITEKVSAPTPMTREDYADLFDAVRLLSEPYLSSIGLKPLEQITNRVFPQNSTEQLDQRFRGSRLALVYQTPRIKNMLLASQRIHEVYLTEQNYWITLKTWRTGPEAIKILFTRDEFLSYYDKMSTENLIHPDLWLLEGLRMHLNDTVNRAEVRLSSLREFETQLEGWERRYQLIAESTI